MKFNVTKDKDEDDNSADLSLTIKNNTNKDVKFNQAKFSLMADGDKKASSEKTGTIVVRAGHKGTIDELFEDVSTDVLNSTNLSIQYLNSDNVVAKPDLAEKQDSDDANQNTQANNQNQNNNSNNTAGATDTSSNADNSADNNANQASANRVVTSPDQAKSMMISATGGTGSLWTATDNGSGYTVTNDSGESGTISYSGDTTTPDGRFFSYQEYLNDPQH